MSRLSLDNVSISSGEKLLLSNCSDSFSPGELNIIFGRSGCGKSTLLKSLCHLLPFTGRISLDDRDILELRPTELRRRVQYLHQEPHLFPGTVRENFLILKTLKQYRDLQLDDELMISQLQGVGLTAELLERPVERLSGGEKQRVCIVRALLVKPDFLLLDEPSSALDIATEAELISLLKDLAKRIGIITVSHSVSFIQAADRALLLRPDGLQQLPLPLNRERIQELVENDSADS